jgi:flagellar hook-associated protein 3 FlgL
MYNFMQTQLQRLTDELTEISASVSTGRKYRKISDNPVDVSAMMGLGAESSQVDQYGRNLNTANNWLTATETALTNINDIVSSTMALANQMATGTYDAAQRASAAQQVQQYMEEVMQIGNSQFDGKYILGGYKTDSPPFTEGNWTIQSPKMQLQSGSTGAATSSGTYTGASSVTYLVQIVDAGATGTATYEYSQDGGRTWSTTAATSATPVAIGSQGVQVAFSGNWVAGDRFTIAVNKPITYQGDQNSLELNIGRDSRMTVNVVGSRAVGGAGGANDLFQIMADLKSALEANDANQAGASLEALQGLQDNLTSNLAGLGASLNRVSIKQDTYTTLKEELTSNLSNLGDTDLIQAVSDLESKKNAYQAALVASSKTLGMSLMDYI